MQRKTATSKDIVLLRIHTSKGKIFNEAAMTSGPRAAANTQVGEKEVGPTKVAAKGKEAAAKGKAPATEKEGAKARARAYMGWTSWDTIHGDAKNIMTINTTTAS